MEQYINKDDLVKEIKKLIKKNDVYGKPSYIADVCYKQILSYINTLEVKEVDLEKEVDNQIRLLGGVHTMENGTNWYKGPYSELVFFAKYFFELGIKTIKGE